MTPRRFYVTTAIPYVNARPHLGHALEFVQADVLARHRRQRGDAVRFQTGTDDNALKNVQAAEAAGLDVQTFVNRNASRFAALRNPLDLSFDDFIRTSTDPRHRLGVERLWRACEASGDLYRRFYEGLYCVGCEQFLTAAELWHGRCPEHESPPVPVKEENWFFRLPRYQSPLIELIDSGRLRIEPEGRRNEMLAFIGSGLEDFSISRSHERAHGWGIPVPGDPSQVIYVWWDALGNYVTALGYGSPNGAYRQWWAEGGERVHVIGKGILRFHAVYWPALLLSAGEPLPTTIFVHDYLTVDGSKISKSLGNAVDPVDLAARFGTDAVRWWLLRDPRAGDADFSVERLIARHNEDLANGLGNLVNRTTSLVWKYRDGQVPSGRSGAPSGAALAEALRRAPERIDAALARFDFRQALQALLAVVTEGNRLVEATRPWELAPAERSGSSDAAAGLDDVLASLVAACQLLAKELRPFLPAAASRLEQQCAPALDHLARPRPPFPRIET